MSAIIISAFGGRAHGATAKFTPSVIVGYNYNSNIGSVDPDLIDPVAMQWISYLVGLDGSLKSQYYILQLGGSAGYEQYVSASSELRDQFDTRTRKFDYFGMDLHGSLTYARRNFTLTLADDIRRNRLISDIFPAEISEFSDVYLYTDNVASLATHFSVGKNLAFSLGYSYETLIYEEPPSDFMFQPADLTRQGGFGKAEMNLGPRSKLFLEGHADQWIYGDATLAGPDDTEIEQEVVDYNNYIILLTYKYLLTRDSTLSLIGGARMTDYFNRPEGRDFEDHWLPMGRIVWETERQSRSSLALIGEYGESTYGQNLFFTYWFARANFKYYFVKHLYASLTGSYREDAYDRDRLGLENTWDKDRLDQVAIAGVGAGWDILTKADSAYLSVEAHANYNFRDSNIDGEADDFDPEFLGVPASYDTEVFRVYAGVIFSPTILLGPK